MNSVIALVLGLAVVVLGYWIYAAWVDRRIIQPDAKRATPARMFMDGVDFMPTARNVLFGYQFKSIAGAAPVVGAIVALQWGWLPAMLWLFLGVFFIGWIHDYASAVISMRSEGMTFGGLSHRLISPRARLILLAFIYFYLLLVAGAFGAIIATLMAGVGQSVLGLLVLIGAGLLAGQMIYRWKRDIILTSAVTVALAVGGIVLGTYLPAGRFMGALAGNTTLWAVFAFVFCYLGATLPIWRFAQPINYVSFYIVFLGLVGGAIGVLVGHPNFTLPAFTGVSVPGLGPLWPILFVTLACGAISGWHSLVSSSGTSRQLESETDAKPVAAGSMFAEMMLGLLTVIAVATAFKAAAGATAYQQYLAVLHPGPDKTVAGAVFAVSLAGLLKYLGISIAFGKTFAAVLIIVLAITVMQLVIRFMRIATAELVGDAVPVMRNVHVATFVASVLALLLVLTGWWQYLWILFGGANQLMASLALLLVSVWLVTQRRSAAFAFIPMIFMFVTTVAALGYTAYTLFAKVAAGAVQPQQAVGNVLMAIIGVFLIVAALLLVADGTRALRAQRAQAAAAPASGGGP